MPEKNDHIEPDLKILIGGVLGESSLLNSFEEMAAIAAVLIRQKNSRSRDTWKEFVQKEKSFAFAFSDGNPRYKLVSESSDRDVIEKEPMATAYKAAKHALDGGVDYSNGGYFWDGDDIKSNYKNHFKVKKGIHFTSSSHNIFNIEESSVKYQKYKTSGKGKDKKKELVKECDWVYESTAAYGGVYVIKKQKMVIGKDKKPKKVVEEVEKFTGTIFWKMSKDYVEYFNYKKEHL